MTWAIAIIGITAVIALSLIAVGRVSIELERTVAPAELHVDDAVNAVAEALPFEVASTLSHADVGTIVSWILDWFDEIGLASEFGEELGGEWAGDRTITVDEMAATEYAVAQGLRRRPAYDAVHVTVVVDGFLGYLRDIGAIAGEVR